MIRHFALMNILLIGLAGLAFANPAVMDTVLVEDLVVVGQSGDQAAPSTVVFTAEAIELVSPWNAGDLEMMIPAASINVNSRGESLLMIRGAPERHITVTLDGIPLTIPWDERADLSLIPLDGVASLQAERGITTLLSGANAIAGRLDLRTQDRRGPAITVSARGASGADYSTRGVVRSRRGGWDVLAAASYRDRDSVVLPDGVELPFHQGDGDLRTNTGLRQASALVRASRTWGGGERLSLLMLATDAERGVAPEGHIEDARFWRLPLVRRGLLGLTYERPMGSDWNLETMAALDAYAQDIREYSSSAYDDPGLVAGDELEEGRDLTAHGRVAARRFIGQASDIAFSAQVRVTRHRESVIVDGPVLEYSQRLLALACEANHTLNNNWSLRTAAGLDIAATPGTGDKPAQDARTAPTLLATVKRGFGGSEARLSVSRRSRFPGLREMFSGALGRFVPNPDLDPEQQDLIEAGITTQQSGWDLGLTGFAANLNGGIEKTSLGDGQFQRVNRSIVQTSGLEFAASRRLGAGVTIGLHHALLDAVVVDDVDSVERPAEDRPNYQGALLTEWRHHTGWHASAAARWIGKRASTDITNIETGLRELGADAWLDVWFGKRFDRGVDSSINVKVGVRNVTDGVIWEQTGLPGAGRVLVVGVGLE